MVLLGDAVVDAALARFTAVVEAPHGKVLQHAGDNLLAAFSATEPRLDDAELEALPAAFKRVFSERRLAAAQAKTARCQ